MCVKCSVRRQTSCSHKKFKWTKSEWASRSAGCVCVGLLNNVFVFIDNVWRRTHSHYQIFSSSMIRQPTLDRTVLQQLKLEMKKKNNFEQQEKESKLQALFAHRISYVVLLRPLRYCFHFWFPAAWKKNAVESMLFCLVWRRFAAYKWRLLWQPTNVCGCACESSLCMTVGQRHSKEIKEIKINNSVCSFVCLFGCFFPLRFSVCSCVCFISCASVFFPFSSSKNVMVLSFFEFLPFFLRFAIRSQFDPRENSFYRKRSN